MGYRRLTVKQYLNQIQDCRKRIREKQEQIEQKRILTESITAGANDVKVQSSGDYDKMAAAVANIVDMESELQVMISEYIATEKVISAQIDAVDRPLEREALHWRYVCGKTFEETSVIIGKTYRHTTRIHGLALKNFREKYKIR